MKRAEAEIPQSLAWGATAAGVVLAGLALYLARAELAPAFDRWLPPPRPPREIVEMPAVVVPAPQLEPQPTAPEWTFEEVAAALDPLPAAIRQLVAEGRRELPEFSGLSSRDPAVALPARNRWQSWGRIWHNRIRVIAERLPPAEECARHAAWKPVSEALARSLALLGEVPDAERIARARELLARVEAELDELERWQQEEDRDDGQEAGADPGEVPSSGAMR